MTASMTAWNAALTAPEVSVPEEASRTWTVRASWSMRKSDVHGS